MKNTTTALSLLGMALFPLIMSAAHADTAILLGVAAAPALGSGPSLPSARAEVETMRDIFREAGYDNIILLSDRQATKNAVRTAIAGAHGESRIVFYASARGVRLPNGGRGLVTYDTQPGDDKTCLPLAAIGQWIRAAAAPSTRTAVLLDADFEPAATRKSEQGTVAPGRYWQFPGRAGEKKSMPASGGSREIKSEIGLGSALVLTPDPSSPMLHRKGREIVSSFTRGLGSIFRGILGFFRRSLNTRTLVRLVAEDINRSSFGGGGGYLPTGGFDQNDAAGMVGILQDPRQGSDSGYAAGGGYPLPGSGGAGGAYPAGNGSGYGGAGYPAGTAATGGLRPASGLQGRPTFHDRPMIRLNGYSASQDSTAPAMQDNGAEFTQELVQDAGQTRSAAAPDDLIRMQNPAPGQLGMTVNPAQSLRPGQPFTIQLRHRTAGWLYLFNKDQNGRIQFLPHWGAQPPAADADGLLNQAALNRGGSFQVGRGQFELRIPAASGGSPSSETVKAIFFTNREEARRFAQAWLSATSGGALPKASAPRKAFEMVPTGAVGGFARMYTAELIVPTAP